MQNESYAAAGEHNEVTKRKSLGSDLRVLWHLVAHPVRGKSHAERLESFYSGQADSYDSFRSRMLHGRRELIQWIDFPEGGTWVDMGAGTGENVVHAGDAAHKLAEIHLVDLSSSLMKVASERMEKLGLNQAQTHLADATEFSIGAGKADVISFSYSLTMIPDWFEALAMAEAMLKPGGCIAVTDFYVSRKYVSEGWRRHGWLRRAFWTHWFANDNVYLNGDHINMLHRRFTVERFEEHLGKVPYLPFLRAPYYLLIGRKKSEGTDGL